MRARSVAAAMTVVILAAITLGGLVWTVTQALRSSEYEKAEAVVTACEISESDGKKFVSKVTVAYAYNGNEREATYIGDLDRCRVGLKMTVYYKISGDKGYVYSKASDLGFALIMLIAGGVWTAVAVIAIVMLRRGGFFAE